MTHVRRQTKETTIHVALELQGDGTCEASTGNAFLDHMLTTLAKYAGFTLRVEATGDLDHHLVEDVAIAVGQAFKEAHANAPCARMAYDIVAMDDVLMVCALDLVDRPYYAGDLLVPLWDHWFRSFAMEARVTLHLERRRGRDTHHETEAAFKALGRCLKQALQPRDALLSTKGSVNLETS